MKDMYNDRTKSNDQLFSTQNSYPEQINKIRYKNLEYGGIMNSNNIRINPENKTQKMNILKIKPEHKKLSPELNYKVVCIIILVVCVLGFISFIIVYFIKKAEKKDSKDSNSTLLNKTKKTYESNIGGDSVETTMDYSSTYLINTISTSFETTDYSSK